MLDQRRRIYSLALAVQAILSSRIGWASLISDHPSILIASSMERTHQQTRPDDQEDEREDHEQNTLGDDVGKLTAEENARQ